MLQILNLAKAKAWSEKNLYEADSFLYPLKVAVNCGLLMEIDEEHFAVVETEHFGCTWVLDEIKRLSDEEMKELDLYVDIDIRNTLQRTLKAIKVLQK